MKAAALISAVVLTGCSRDGHTEAVEKSVETKEAIAASSSRVAAHVEAALDLAVALTPSAPLALTGNLRAALAGLPRPSVSDAAVVAGLKDAKAFADAAKQAEARAAVANDRERELEAIVAELKSGRAEDRADADARLWRLAAVGLVIAAAVTGYLFKDPARSAILGLCGVACAFIPALLNPEILRWGAWGVLALVLAVLVWLGRKLWLTESGK